MNTTKQQFNDKPTRTEVREFFNAYMATNRKLNGADLCLGLADAFTQFSETEITIESHPGYFEKVRS